MAGGVKVKKPTVKQCRIIEQDLGLNYKDWLVRKWREFKGGIEICLVHRETRERLEKVVER